MDSDIKLHAEIYSFDLPLRASLFINRKKITSRQGFVLILSTSDGVKGYGEISPLPGFHTETNTEAFRQLQNTCTQLPSLDQIVTDLNSRQLFEFMNLYPSVRFGLESAIIDLIANQNGISPAHVLEPQNNCRHVKVNGLITREDNFQNDIQYFLQRGYQTVKIKLGKDPVDFEIQKILSLHELIDNRMKIRIDINQNWTLSQAEEFYKGINNLAIEYIEEPLQDAKKLPELFKLTGMPLALDESIPQLEEFSEFFDWCTAIILKPAIIGGVLKTQEYIKLASKHGVKSIISDTFHTSIGITMLANLSALAGADKTAMGLDTIRWMGDDLLKNTVEIQGGIIDLLIANRNRQNIDLSKLNRLL
jgi:o-succinylbenzoate synthase